MEIHHYFLQETLIKRPYIEIAWCIAVVQNPIKTETQADGKKRHWGFVPELGKYLRVITLHDDTVLFNAFPDRRFTP